MEKVETDPLLEANDGTDVLGIVRLERAMLLSVDKDADGDDKGSELELRETELRLKLEELELGSGEVDTELGMLICVDAMLELAVIGEV